MTKPTDDQKTRPFSLRLTFQERASLEQEAGDIPLGGYIRSVLLDETRPRKRTRFKRPVKDHKALGQVLAELGATRIASNLNQLAKAANSGSLPVTEETEQEIKEACKTVQWMRDRLVAALGLYQE